MVDEDKAAGADDAAGAGVDAKKLLAELAELRDAMKAKDAQFDALKETYERTNALVQTMVERGGGGQPAGAGGGSRRAELRLSRDYASEFNIPNEAVQAIVEEAMTVAESKFDGRFTNMQNAAKQRDAFYKDNPDLVGSEFLVSSISMQVDQELPNKSIAEKFKEVAARTRSTIKRYQDARSDGDEPIDQPAGAGGGSTEGRGAGGGGDKPEAPLTPEAELAAEVADRNKFRGSRGNARR